MNLVALTLAARKNTGEFIGVPMQGGKCAIARYTKIPGKRTAVRELLTEWTTIDHVASCLAEMAGIKPCA